MKRPLIILPTMAALLFAAGCGDSSSAETVRKGLARAAAEDWKGACRQAERVLADEPDQTDALILKAVAAARLGDSASALDAARRAATLNPESYAAQYTLGRLYSAAPERRGEAIQALWRAYKLRPTDSRALLLLCNTAAAANHPQLASFLNLLRKFPEQVNTSEWHNQMGVAMLRRGDYNRAKQEFIAACRSGKRHPVALLNTAIFFDRFTTGRGRNTARQLYAEFIRRTGDSPEFAADRAIARDRMTRLDRQR